MIKNCAVFNGVGSAIYLGLGNRPPDAVRILNLEGTDMPTMWWNRNMRASECVEGFKSTNKTDSDVTGQYTDADPLTAGNGIQTYDGGDVVASGNTTYLVKVGMDPNNPGSDKRDSNVVNGKAAIRTWALDTSGNRTGHWNDECNTTWIGEGSVIVIRENTTGLRKVAVVTALTSNGEQADEVTLSKAIASGTIEYLGPMYDFWAAPAGVTMPAGIKISETADINVSGEMCMIEWEYWDGPNFPD